MCISRGFMRDDAFTAALVPGILGAPSRNVDHVLAGPTEAILTVSGRAVAAA